MARSNAPGHFPILMRYLFMSRLSHFWASAGIFLLLLSVLPVASLSQGGSAAHAAVFLLILALAGLALWLLLRLGVAQERLLAALLPIGLAFFLRALLLDYQSADYQMFLSQWAQSFRDNGGFAAVQLPIGNYNAPYLYFLAVISYLPVPDLYLIKLFSILFDVVLAWGGFRLVRCFAPQESPRPLLGFCLLLLLPTVVLNGAFWGQCDALYGALCLHALACALERRDCASLALLGVAFSFKLQTVFLLPLWAGLLLLRRVRLRSLLCFPAAYGITCVPALLLGKPLKDILGVYFGQAAEYSDYLNLNAPNLYSFLPYGMEVDTESAARLGIVAAFAFVFIILALLWLFRRRIHEETVLTAAVLMVIGVPFLLPHMHERYFFLADILALVWAVSVPCSAPCALLVQLSSLGAYVAVLREKFTLIVSLGGQLFPMFCEAALMLTALVLALIHFLHDLILPVNLSVK